MDGQGGGGTGRSDRVDLPYPRRRLMRGTLKMLAAAALHTVGSLRVEGRENLPDSGPFLLVGNHFHFADPVALLHLCDRQVEFVGGFRFPNAPWIVKFIPSLWGYLPAYRGAYSRSTLDYAMQILGKGGVVGIFPEGGAWAQVLRPPRPGAAWLATEAGVPVVPVGLDGFPQLFKSWRPQLTLRIGEPVGPFEPAGSEAERRQRIDAVGEEIMKAIASLIPPERRGVYSEEEAAREAARAAAVYPFSRRDMRGM